LATGNTPTDKVRSEWSEGRRGIIKLTRTGGGLGVREGDVHVGGDGNLHERKEGGKLGAGDGVFGNELGKVGEREGHGVAAKGGGEERFGIQSLHENFHVLLKGQGAAEDAGELHAINGLAKHGFAHKNFQLRGIRCHPGVQSGVHVWALEKEEQAVDVMLDLVGRV